MRTHHRSDVIDSDIESTGTADVRVTESESRFSPGQIVHAAIGAFLVVLGIVCMVRGDLSGDLTEPTFDVLGITHNTAIGIGELVAGALLLLAAAGWWGRLLGVIVGLALVAFGTVLLSDDGFMRDVGTEDALAWLAIGVGGAAVLFGLIPGRRTVRRRIDRPATA